MNPDTNAHLLPYGLTPDGRLVHIADVPSGLACDCRCPECSGVLVARKGEVVAHHFAHHAGSTCRGGGWETAVHRLCKEAFVRSREMMLPEVTAAWGGRRTPIAEAGLFHYDGAREEVVMDGIIPDIVVHRGDRILLVEVLVTHPCGTDKIRILQARNLPCVEVDMSAVDRGLSRADHERLVLRDAPRRWLHNPRIAEATGLLQAAQDKDELTWQAHRVRTIAPRLARIWHEPPVGCTRVSVDDLEASLFLCLKRIPKRSCTMGTLMEHLGRNGILKPSFGDIAWTPDLLTAMRVVCPGFLSPPEEVSSWLARVGGEVEGGIVSMPAEAFTRLANGQALAHMQTRRRREIAGYVERLARHVPSRQSCLAAWAQMLDVQARENDNWQQCKGRIEAVLHMLSGGPELSSSEMMGLDDIIPDKHAR